MTNPLKTYRLLQAIKASFTQRKITIDPPPEEDIGKVALVMFVATCCVLLVLVPLGFTYGVEFCIDKVLPSMHGWKGLFQFIAAVPWFISMGFFGHFIGKALLYFRPLSRKHCSTMLELISNVDGGREYHQKMLAQIRPAYAFDMMLLQNMKRGIIAHHEEQMKDWERRREESDCKTLNGLQHYEEQMKDWEQRREEAACKTLNGLP